MALTKSINDYAKANDLNRPVTKSGKKGKPMGLFSQSDVLDGLNCVFEIRVPGALATSKAKQKKNWQQHKQNLLLKKLYTMPLQIGCMTIWMQQLKLSKRLLKLKNASDAAKESSC